MGSGGGGSAPAPDPQIGHAALKNAQTGEEWLKFARDAYATQVARQGPIDELANKVTEQQLAIAKDQQQWATETRDRYRNVFLPLQDKFIETAENWDTPEKQAAAAASAKADVVGNAANMRGQNQRSMAAMGLNPASGRWTGVDRASDLGTAVSAAGAQTGARNLVTQQGLALRGNAVNLGNGLPVVSSTATGLGLNAGTGAANITNAANQQALSAYPIMNAGFQGQMQGYANQANVLQNQYNSQLQAWQAQQAASSSNAAGIFSGIGSLMGLFMSSKKLKTGRKPATGNLAKVKKLPVETYRYKKGVADGGVVKHTGPMAEDFRAVTGKGDGRTIMMQDAIGLTLGAVQELAGKVGRIEKAVGLGKRVAANGTRRAA